MQKTSLQIHHEIIDTFITVHNSVFASTKALPNTDELIEHSREIAEKREEERAVKQDVIAKKLLVLAQNTYEKKTAENQNALALNKTAFEAIVQVLEKDGQMEILGMLHKELERYKPATFLWFGNKTALSGSKQTSDYVMKAASGASHASFHGSYLAEQNRNPWKLQHERLVKEDEPQLYAQELLENFSNLLLLENRKPVALGLKSQSAEKLAPVL